MPGAQARAGDSFRSLAEHSKKVLAFTSSPRVSYCPGAGPFTSRGLWHGEVTWESVSTGPAEGLLRYAVLVT